MKLGFIGIGAVSMLYLMSCNSPSLEVSAANNHQPSEETEELTTSTKADADYWYHNKAEITSYRLQQARYGEVHEGNAVLVFVTEPFSPSSNTKADQKRPDNVSVLKLNHTRKFNTGIYPYSMMTSSFFPFKKGNRSVKISSSSQEWCGHTFMEVREKEGQLVSSLDSYFEGESYENDPVEKAVFEDDILTMLRIRNDQLPEGKTRMYPSLMFTRLMHVDFKAYDCEAKLSQNGATGTYVLNFPELERIVIYEFENKHPYKIISWEETYFSGFGNNRAPLTTTATRMKSINTDYWNKNSLADSTLRKELNL